ncbi:MAG: hypothetical protein KBD56_04490 [Candidatus Eisenbacteria bacterium]|nr:hypothetical protein [Candidatus Eisenbacteria bacterium]
METVRILCLLAFLWTLASLAYQWRAGRARRRRDYSLPRGSASRGRVWFLTAGMLPSHKESVRLHPVSFALGLLMHIGLFGALAVLLLLIIHPLSGRVLAQVLLPLLAGGLSAGMILFVRRILSRTLRSMSSFDDYLAILATCGLLAATARLGLDPARSRLAVQALAYGIFLFAYLPLGKLRHALFFFVARADQGARLGYRGVLPPARRGERAHG